MAKVDISIIGGATLSVETGDSLFNILRANHIYIPTICGGKGFCGKCRVRIVSSEQYPITDKDKKHFTEKELAQGWRLSCQVMVDKDISVELPKEIAGIKMFKGVVSETEYVSHDIKRVRIDLKEPTDINYLAGAVVMVDIPTKFNTARPYSIATSPSSKNCIEINVKRVPNGVGSGYIHDVLKVGDVISFTGPYSGYTVKECDAPLVLVAGGSGMSPIISILKDSLERNIQRPIRYIFGVNTEEELLYVDLMREFEKHLHDFKFLPTVVSPTSDSNVQKGNVLDGIEANVTNYSSSYFYLCGGAGMLNAVVAFLKEKGLEDESKIFFDKFN